MAYSLKVKITGNACITRYDNGEAADLKTILDTNYPSLSPTDRASVVEYVAGIRPDIPYEIGTLA
jgi:hypothetical protein